MWVIFFINNSSEYLIKLCIAFSNYEYLLSFSYKTQCYFWKTFKFLLSDRYFTTWRNQYFTKCNRIHTFVLPLSWDKEALYISWRNTYLFFVQVNLVSVNILISSQQTLTPLVVANSRILWLQVTRLFLWFIHRCNQRLLGIL